MSRRMCFTAGALLGLTVFAYPVAAQNASALRLGAGLEQAALRNPAQSPYRLAGWGPAFLVGFERRTRISNVNVSLHGGVSSMNAPTSGGAATDRVASFDVRYVRALRSSVEPPSWMVGAQLETTMDLANHRYAPASGGYDDRFGFLTTGFAAVLRASCALRNRPISGELAIPIASWVDFPYSNAKVDADDFRLRFAGPNTLQGFTGLITYHTAATGRFGVDWQYRVRYLRYASTEVRRYARQSLSAVIKVPLTGTAR